MFCLRSWVPLLIFLTNTAPIYVALFLVATYALQRPCVYCSILLFVLIFSLFDFSADWFEARWPKDTGTSSEILSSAFSGNSTVPEALVETATLALSAINGTGGSLVSTIFGSLSSRLSAQDPSTATAVNAEIIRNFLEKRQLRIPCLDVTVRL